MDVQLPNGTVIRGVPDGTTKAQLAEKLQSNGMNVPKEWLGAKAPPADPITSFDRTVGGAVADVGRSALQGAAADIVGAGKGLVAGVATGAEAMRTGDSPLTAFDKGADAAADEITDTKRSMAYEPQTAAGKTAMAGLAKGADYARQLADKTGLSATLERGGDALRETVRETAIDLGVPQDVAERVGSAGEAAVKTYLTARGTEAVGERLPNGAPAKGPSSLRGAAAAREAALKPRAEPTLEPQAAPAATTPPSAAPAPQPQLSASGAARQPYSQVGAGPVPPPKLNPTEAKAAAYARSIGLDWTRLGLGMRKALTSVAQDATALERLDPAAVKREALLQSQRIPVPATRGALTRDPAELRREAIVSRTTAGQPIRDVDIAANRAVQGNLEALRGRAAGLKGGLHDPVNEEGIPAPTPSIRAATKLPSQVGEAAQKAVREKQKWSKKGYEALYKRARETEPNVKVSATPLKELLDNNPEVQHLGFLKGWLSRADKTSGNHITLKELHDLRQEATGIARAGGVEGYYAGKVVGQIDDIMKTVPEGAKAWKSANEAFKKHQAEFKDQATVSDQRLKPRPVAIRKSH